jgi:hypothetical protein
MFTAFFCFLAYRFKSFSDEPAAAWIALGMFAAGDYYLFVRHLL